MRCPELSSSRSSVVFAPVALATALLTSAATWGAPLAAQAPATAARRVAPSVSAAPISSPAMPPWLRAASAARRPGSPTRLTVDRNPALGNGPQSGGANGMPQGGPQGAPGGGPTGAPSGEPGGGTPYPYYQPDCGTDLGDLVAGDGVDLGTRGFDWRTPGAAFALQSFSAREACFYPGPWPVDGSLPDESEYVARLAADSSLRHRESKIDVYVSQQVQEKAQANTLYPWAATFWSGGYAFWVYAYGNVYVAGPSVEPAGGVADPADLAELNAAVLREAVAGLAPELDLECFWRRAAGTWSDLAELGIGDPRPAVPSDFDEVAFYLDRMLAPAASCNALPHADRDYFSASFQRGASGQTAPTGGAGGGSGSGGGDGGTGEDDPEGDDEPSREEWGWLSASASTRLAGDPSWPTYFDGVSLYWATEHHHFSVYGYDGGGPFEQEVLFAIARALDPTFQPPAL